MISVCMTTYNGMRFIKQQIESILSQLDLSDELIISDDGSSDETLKIIDSFNDSRIKLLKHEKNPKISKIKYSRNFYYATENFENAIKNAKGEYIFLSDQDDIWPDGRKQSILYELSTNDCVMCNCNVIDENNACINDMFFEHIPYEKSILKNTLKRTPFLGCCMAFKASALSYILPFPKNLCCHDLWIGCLCAHFNQLKFIPKVLHNYRLHGNNVSPSANAGSKNPLWFRLWYRICFIKQISIRIVSLTFRR